MLKKKLLAGLAIAGASAVLVACGTGSSSSGISAAGTAAQGKPIAGASIALTCANGASLTAVTDSNGKYFTAPAVVAYPCVGTARQGSLSYRTILFSGNIANFTPLTELLVTVVLTASGDADLSGFLTKVQTPSYAVSVINFASSYRSAVITALKNIGVTDAQLSALSSNFESVSFNADGTGDDKVLDDTKSKIQNSDGSVNTTARDQAIVQGQKAPKPSATGASGSTGSSS
ncbi:MAG: hypothetical protein ACK5NY_01245 [Burkholderiaceae bacterium]